MKRYDSKRQASAESKSGIHSEAMKVAVAWMDETENRVSIEEGGYGDIESLIRRVCHELGMPFPTPPRK